MTQQYFSAMTPADVSSLAEKLQDIADLAARLGCKVDLTAAETVIGFPLFAQVSPPKIAPKAAAATTAKRDGRCPPPPEYPWTDEQDDALTKTVVEAVKQGRTRNWAYSQVAEQHGRTFAAVKRRALINLGERIEAELQGVERKRATLVNNGNLPFGGNGGIWTAEEDQAIRDAAQENPGLSKSALSRLVCGRIDRTWQAVSYRMRTVIPEYGQQTPTGGGTIPPAILLDLAAGEASPSFSGPDDDSNEDDGAGEVPTLRAAPPAVVMPIDDDAPRWERMIVATLNALGYAAPHDAETDLELIERQGAGDKIAAISDDLGIPKPALVARWKMLTGAAENEQGAFGLIEQERLVAVLRKRVAIARAAA